MKWVIKASATRQRALALLVGLAALAGRASPAQQSPASLGTRPTGTRRALIVGISRYLYLAVDKQPRYAAADAQLFHDFLRSKAGGAIADSAVTMLLNDQATTQEIEAGLGWLNHESKPGDEAIIYFAGLGDVQEVDGNQRSVLLATEALSSHHHEAGSLEVNFPRELIQGIAQKGATVFLIADASGAGELTNDVGASGATAALLEPGAGDDVVKLVSCSPNQPSYASTKWGGGHGVFTYFLIAGLKGLADANGDGIVTVGELWRYIHDNVQRETSGRQTPPPPPTGDLSRQIAVVDTATVRATRARLTTH